MHKCLGLMPVGDEGAVEGAGPWGRGDVLPQTQHNVKCDWLCRPADSMLQALGSPNSRGQTDSRD